MKPSTLETSLETSLELLLDTTTLKDMIETLSCICAAKAEHLYTNWQDASAARSWRRDAVVIGNIEHRIEN